MPVPSDLETQGTHRELTFQRSPELCSLFWELPLPFCSPRCRLPQVLSWELSGFGGEEEEERRE